MGSDIDRSLHNVHKVQHWEGQVQLGLTFTDPPLRLWRLGCSIFIICAELCNRHIYRISCQLGTYMWIIDCEIITWLKIRSQVLSHAEQRHVWGQTHKRDIVSGIKMEASWEQRGKKSIEGEWLKTKQIISWGGWEAHVVMKHGWLY